MNDSTDWLTLKEAGKILGKTPSALRRMIQRAQFERIRKDKGNTGDYWLIHRDEVRSRLEAERAARAGVREREKSVHMNVISFDTYIEQQKSWEKERDQLMSGLLMYRHKYEEIESKLITLPVPIDQMQTWIEEKEKEKNELTILIDIERSQKEQALYHIEELEKKSEISRSFSAVDNVKNDEALENLNRELDEAKTELSILNDTINNLNLERQMLEDSLKGEQQQREDLERELNDERLRYNAEIEQAKSSLNPIMPILTPMQNPNDERAGLRQKTCPWCGETFWTEDIHTT